MERKIIFAKENFSLKNPKHPQKNVFIIHSPRTIKIEPATHMKIDTGLTLFLPQNSKGFLISIFQRDKINEIFHGKHRLWIEILNKSSENPVKIERNQSQGFLVIGLEHLRFHHEAPKKKEEDTKQRENIIV